MQDHKQFLKQHSVIPEDFIDKFLSMYNPETIQTDFVVNFDDACDWLRIRKDSLKRTLAAYTKGIDYTEKHKAKKVRYGGNNYIEILLTPDCFKRLCMRSRTKRAEEVRTYFIELESLLVRYRTTLLKGMDQEVKEMQRSLKPKDPGDSAGYIYVLKAHPHKDSIYKIGRTQDLNQRLRTYSTGTTDGVELVFKYRTESHKATEACVKSLLLEQQFRKYKEVYEANLQMIKDLISGCDDLTKYKRVYTNSRPAKIASGGYYLFLEKETFSKV